MKRQFSWLALKAILLAGCGGESEAPGNPEQTGCQAQSLPLEGGDSAPSLTDLYLDCTRSAVELLAVVSDQQGDADLGNVPQILRVHRSRYCDAGTIEISDDVAANREVEAFGVVLDKDELPDVYAAICAADQWPVDAELRDASENVVSGRVLATVMGDEP